MMRRECGGGLQGAVCVVVRVGEAKLERTSGGGGVAPKTWIPSVCTRYWSCVCNAHGGGGDGGMLGRFYTAVKLIRAGD
jgi:hypothetical protein